MWLPLWRQVVCFIFIYLFIYFYREQTSKGVFFLFALDLWGHFKGWGQPGGDEATALRVIHSYLPPLGEMHVCEDKQKVNSSSGEGDVMYKTNQVIRVILE